MEATAFEEESRTLLEVRNDISTRSSIGIQYEEDTGGLGTEVIYAKH